MSDHPRPAAYPVVSCLTRPRAPRPRPRRAFTLIETALATVIIGVGVLAIIEAQQAFMRANDWATHSASATYLAGEIREFSRRLPRHDPVTGLYLHTQGGTTSVVGWGPEPGETDISDIDDIDDLDGITFLASGTNGMADGDLPGPIDAFGSVIPEINADGTVRVNAQGEPMALQGWSQTVRVEKVDPFDTSIVRLREYTIAPSGADTQGVGIDQFPLRVTVTVRFQGPDDVAPRDIATVVWIVP